MKKCLLLAFLFPLFLQAQPRLSPLAEIRVITCGPYQGELYSAFGHSAIRVIDPASGLDILYNYGVFNFNQPNFYLNFAKGHLNYRLDEGEYQRFVDSYIKDDRFVHEQILNLNIDQSNKIFEFLQWNALPENMYYRYDYFYDNCATRIRDALKQILGEELTFDESHITTEYSIRDLCDIFLTQQKWGDLGIDICLGVPMDKKATPDMYMFLPEYLEGALNNAYVNSNGHKEPLVRETIATFDPQVEPVQKSWNVPCTWFTLLLIIGIGVTLLENRRKKMLRCFDTVIFGTTGLVGWFLLILWLATDHKAAAYNMNLIWLIPFHFPLAIFLCRSHRPKFLKPYFGINALVIFLTLVLWKKFPQDLPVDAIPLILLLGIRSIQLFRFMKIKKPRTNVASAE